MSHRLKIAVMLSAICSVLLFGTLGFRLFTGWSWFDSFYFTLITITTIGYTEPPGMTQEARYFGTALIVLGVGILGYVLSVIGQSIVSNELVASLGRRRMIKDISQLSQHYIVCGAGRVGLRVASEIQSHGHDVVLVEGDEQEAELLVEQGYLVMSGDATNEEVLKQAGLVCARGLVCAVSSDPENLYITLTARDLNPDILIVARANEESAVPRLTRAGANRVVSPAITGSHQITQVLLKPAVADFIELATMAEKLELEIEQIAIGPTSELADTSLRDAEIHARLNVMIIAIKRDGEPMQFNPKADTLIRANDALMAMGSHSDLKSLAGLAGNL